MMVKRISHTRGAAKGNLAWRSFNSENFIEEQLECCKLMRLGYH